MHAHFCMFGADLYPQWVLINKISASQLSRKLSKSALLLVGYELPGESEPEHFLKFLQNLWGSFSSSKATDHPLLFFLGGEKKLEGDGEVRDFSQIWMRRKRRREREMPPPTHLTHKKKKKKKR